MLLLAVSVICAVHAAGLSLALLIAALLLRRGILQIPYGINALAPTHTVPGIASGALRLDAYALSGACPSPCPFS